MCIRDSCNSIGCVGHNELFLNHVKHNFHHENSTNIVIIYAKPILNCKTLLTINIPRKNNHLKDDTDACFKILITNYISVFGKLLLTRQSGQNNCQTTI